MKNVLQYSVQDMLNMYEKKILGIPSELSQAGSRWTKEDRQLFIDSVLNGVALPMFYLYMHVGEKDSEFLYSVHDGKERLIALMDFYGGRIPLSEDFRFFGDNELNERLGTDGSDIAGMYYDDISKKYPVIAGVFLSRRVDCTVFDECSKENVAETFRRLAKKCGGKNVGGINGVNPASPENYFKVTGILLGAIERLMEVSPEEENSLRDITKHLATDVQELEELGVLA